LEAGRSASGETPTARTAQLTAHLRALSLQHRISQATPEALRAIVDAALSGTKLGQRHGDDLWGSNLYLQTVSAIDEPMPWALAHAAAEEGLISLDGAVLGLPHLTRTAPVGPVMDWAEPEPPTAIGSCGGPASTTATRTR